MNVLLAVDDDIHPPRTGGTQRSFGLARGLARAHRVQALCVVPNRSRGPARETVDGVRIVRTRAWQTSVLWRLDRAGVAPMFLARGVHDARLARTTRLIEGVPEVRMADLHLAGLLRPGTAALRVHHSHNVEYDRFRTARGPMCARATWAERLRALEGEVVASADLTVVCSDEDAARMHALHGVARDRFVVVPNGFDETAIAAPDATQRARARAALALADDVQVSVFVGSDWGPNREALAHLVEHVFPALAAQGHALVVVGAVSRALAGRREPWLRVLGEEAGQAEAFEVRSVES